MVRTTPQAEWNYPSTASGAPSVVPVSGMTRTPQFCVACSITQAAAHLATVNSARATGQSGSLTYVVKETKNPSLTARCRSTSRGQPWVECLYQGEATVICASLTTRTLPYNATTRVHVHLCLLKHTFMQFVVCSCDETVYWLQCIFFFFFISVRLVDSKDVFYGRLEMYINKTFTSVCDEGFTDRSAKVACNILGFPYGKKQCCSALGPHPTSEITVTNVQCRGSERSLDQCPHQTTAKVPCRSGKYVSVYCSKNQIVSKGSMFWLVICILYGRIHWL